MISRRRFNIALTATMGASMLPRSAGAVTPVQLGDGWRRFELTTRLDVKDASGDAQAWVPLPSFEQSDWIRPEGSRCTASDNAVLEQSETSSSSLLHVRWGEGARFAEVTSTFVTRDRTAKLTQPEAGVALSDAERDFYLRGYSDAPTEGIVKETADRITAGSSEDVAKANAIYQWVVENTYRLASVPGCGDGNVARMLRSGNLGGKCADLNPLFVALARASGLPARDLYGIRVAPSRLGYKSLGPATHDVTKAQHCRAEVFLDRTGWTPMDPADVRKVMLEERPGGLKLDDPEVASARARLFGSWEGNWLPFNASNDVVLPGAEPRRVNFLMYPEVETSSGMLDCYHPEQVRYTITTRELAI